MHETPTTTKAPQGLFSRIINRFGLERQLAHIKKNLGLFTSLAFIFISLGILAIIGLADMLTYSSFGPYLSLAYSDPSVVVMYPHSFFLSVSESMPGLHLSFFLISLGLVLVAARLIANHIEKFSAIKKSITQNYESR